MEGTRRDYRGPLSEPFRVFAKSLKGFGQNPLPFRRLSLVYIEYIKNTFLSERTMLNRMGYFVE